MSKCVDLNIKLNKAHCKMEEDELENTLKTHNTFKKKNAFGNLHL